MPLNLEALLRILTTCTGLKLIILDVNDNAPFFPDSAHILNVTEDANLGKISLPIAKDSDVAVIL